MQARRKTRLYIVLAVLAGLGLTVSLTLYALSSNIDLFYTPGEIIYGKTETRALPHTGQHLRVGGYVQPGSLQRDPQTLDVRFKLYDARGVVDVSYKAFCRTCFVKGRAWWPRAYWTASGILPPSRCWPNMMKITRRRR
ncbi:Cytochrome c-type biogenesis protein CcmE, heme chaperone [Klebsiella pneumoniae IS33]|nr:Cytochrome c-type biogenesis protein CcmE, heme chaperone [Klebsiella pneumoniae IS33]